MPVAANVIALGAVSLVTDVSSEMVTSVLPIYFVVGLGLNPLAFGLLDGLYTGATALLRLVGGLVADRTGRRKLTAGLGYAVSAAAKPALLAGSSVAAIGAGIAVDRAGKGLRTAPRDALITLSGPSGTLGRAFGVHRAMDATGAFLGPLVALGVLAASGRSFGAVFVTSTCIAVFGVVLLMLFVRDRRETVPGRSAPAPATPTGLAGPTRGRDPVRTRLLLAAVVLGTVTIGEGFVYLILQHRENLSPTWFPILAVGTNLAFLVLATPLGLLADRIGRDRVLLLVGYPALTLVYLALAAGSGTGPAARLGRPVVVLVLLGLFFAASDGVLMALAGPVLPARSRAGDLAVIQTGQALAYLVSSVLFGAAWSAFGVSTATWLAAGAVPVAVVVSRVLLGPVARGRPR
jgi:MFS family permease